MANEILQSLSENTSSKGTRQSERRSCPEHDAKLHMFRDSGDGRGPITNSTFAASARSVENPNFQSIARDSTNNESLVWDDYIETQYATGKHPNARSTLSKAKPVETSSLDKTKFGSNEKSNTQHKLVRLNDFDESKFSSNEQSDQRAAAISNGIRSTRFGTTTFQQPKQSSTIKFKRRKLEWKR